MRTGVRQGSVEGPTLYLIYYSFVMKHWRSRCLSTAGKFGVDWQGCVDGSLRNPSRIRRADCHFLSFSDAEFADDTVYLDSNWEHFQQCSTLLDDTLQLFGACMNKEKTEWLEVTGFSRFRDAAPLPGCKILVVNGVPIPKTAVFRYLGSVISIDSALGVKLDLHRRVSLAHAAFGQLRHVWRSRQLSLRLKRDLLLSCVASVLLFGSERWTLDAADIRMLQRTWRSFLRNALCLSYRQVMEQRISDLALHQRLRIPSILTLLHRRLAQWLGHLARMPVHRITRLALFGTLQNRTSPPASTSSLRQTYLSRLNGLLQSLPSADTRIWAQQAMDKSFWKGAVSAIDIAPQGHSTAPEAKARLRPRRRAPEQDLHCPHPGCTYIGSNLQGLNRRIHSQHGQGGVRIRHCQYCNKEYKHKGALTVHERKCPDRPVVEPSRERVRTAAARTFVCCVARASWTCLSSIGMRALNVLGDLAAPL